MPPSPSQQQIGVIGAVSAIFAAIGAPIVALVVARGRNKTDVGLKAVDLTVAGTNTLILGQQAMLSNLDTENRLLRSEMIAIRAVNVQLQESLLAIKAQLVQMQADHSREIAVMHESHSREMEALRKHVDMSSLVTQAITAAPTLLLHDEVVDIRAQVDANTAARTDPPAMEP